MRPVKVVGVSSPLAENLRDPSSSTPHSHPPRSLSQESIFFLSFFSFTVYQICTDILFSLSISEPRDTTPGPQNPSQGLRDTRTKNDLGPIDFQYCYKCTVTGLQKAITSYLFITVLVTLNPTASVSLHLGSLSRTCVT